MTEDTTVANNLSRKVSQGEAAMGVQDEGHVDHNPVNGDEEEDEDEWTTQQEDNG